MNLSLFWQFMGNDPPLPDVPRKSLLNPQKPRLGKYLYVSASHCVQLGPSIQSTKSGTYL